MYFEIKKEKKNIVQSLAIHHFRIKFGGNKCVIVYHNIHNYTVKL